MKSIDLNILSIKQFEITNRGSVLNVIVLFVIINKFISLDDKFNARP